MPDVTTSAPSPLARFATVMIRGYQRALSPRMGKNCRFQPTCSTYTLESVERFGFFKGSRMGIVRLAKCHPLHEGGYDPVPEKR